MKKQSGNTGDLHKNHRKRMQNKVLNGDIDSMYDHELLEMLLFIPIPRVNTNPIAHRLLNKFGSIPEVLHASESELITVEGVGKSTAKYLKSLEKLFEDFETCYQRELVELSETSVEKRIDEIVNNTIAAIKDSDPGTMAISFLGANGLSRKMYVSKSNVVNYREVVRLSLMYGINSIVICERVNDVSSALIKKVVSILEDANIMTVFAYLVTDGFCIELFSGEVSEPTDY